MSLNSNLKVDAILASTKFMEDEPRIYATGVHLVPMKISVRENEYYVWVADDFDSDSYCDGQNVCPVTLAKNKIGLIKQNGVNE